MVLKRKRNLKIDITTNYSVFFLKDLNQEEIEDYVEVRDTGMEAEEEKEIHLQNIIKGEKKDIPLPVIIEISNPSRSFFRKRTLKKYITHEKDCENLYVDNVEDLEEKERILNNELKKRPLPEDTLPGNVIENEPKKRPLSEDTLPGNAIENELIEKSQKDELIINIVPALETQARKHPTNEELTIEKIPANNKPSHSQEQVNQSILLSPKSQNLEFQNLLKEIGDNKNKLFNKSGSLIDFCLKRTIVRYEKDGFEAYSCFRDRIFHPTFKSRRNEVLMIEKLERMGTELNTLENMCKLLKEKHRLELKAVRKTTKALKFINSIKLTKSKRRSLKKLIVEGPTPSSHGAVPFNLHSVMTNREKIMAMKNIKVSTELYLDIKYYNEVMSIVNNSEEAGQEGGKKGICPACFNSEIIEDGA